MIDSDVIDTTIWPCFTPGMHWALSDDVRKIGSLSSVNTDNDTVEYEINVDNLPDGETGLWHFNALRNFAVGLDHWPSHISDQVTGATLCLGPMALQTVQRTEDDDDIVFSMFSGDSILPLFVVDDSVLTLRVHFKSLDDNHCLPKYAGIAQGLLCKFKNRKRPFFVAASTQSVLSWDGYQSHVFQTASVEAPAVPPFIANVLSESQKRFVHNENSNFTDLLASLPMSPVNGEYDEGRSRYFEDFSLKTPRPE
jgi:hypothetical protein